jgi:hypothetical protein
MGGVSSGLHLLIDHCADVRTSTHTSARSVFAQIGRDLCSFTLSGPPEQVAAVLRDLADKVDAITRQDAA